MVEISELQMPLPARKGQERLAADEALSIRAAKIHFSYSKNLLILEVEGKKTHQTDQKYCERTGAMLHAWVYPSIT